MNVHETSAVNQELNITLPVTFFKNPADNIAIFLVHYQ